MADYLPIWKQRPYQVLSASDTADSIVVNVGDGTDALFRGTAWRRKSGQAVTFYPNDIARTLFTDDVPDVSRAVIYTTPLSIATINVGVEDSIPIALGVNFYRDYSYKDLTGTIISGLPTSGIVMPWNCPLVVSFLPGTHVITKHYKDGTSQDTTLTSTVPETWATGRCGSPTGSTESIDIDGNFLKVSTCGAEYAVLWRNKWGGYDCLPFSGIRKQTDNITRNKFNRLFVQTAEYMQARADVPYLNEVTEQWTLNSGIVNDATAEMIADLLASPAVWLLENLPISKNEPKAINITDSTAEHLTYKNNGGQLLKFTITAEVAQPRERR